MHDETKLRRTCSSDTLCVRRFKSCRQRFLFAALKKRHLHMERKIMEDERWCEGALRTLGAPHGAVWRGRGLSYRAVVSSKLARGIELAERLLRRGLGKRAA
jgi:hypothetical protein